MDRIDKPSRSERSRARITARSYDGRVLAVKFREGEAAETRILRTMFGEAAPWEQSKIRPGVLKMSLDLTTLGMDRETVDRTLALLQKRLKIVYPPYVKSIDALTLEVELAAVDCKQAIKRAKPLLQSVMTSPDQNR